MGWGVGGWKAVEWGVFDCVLTAFRVVYMDYGRYKRIFALGSGIPYFCPENRILHEISSLQPAGKVWNLESPQKQTKWLEGCGVGSAGLEGCGVETLRKH